MTAMSPESAARMNGVCPSKFAHEPSNCISPCTGVVSVRWIGIGALREQRLDQIERIAPIVIQERILLVIEVAQLDGREQRPARVVVGDVRVGPLLEQLRCQRDLAVQQGDEQRRGAIARAPD